MCDKEQIRMQLKQAFECVMNDLSPGETEPSHNDCIILRIEMCLLNPPDLQWYLPRVLIDLLDTHTNDFWETENAEFVIMLLDAKRYMSEGRINDYERKNKEFEIFNKEQSRAILEWLLFASYWSDFELFSDDVLSAIEYWRDRVDHFESEEKGTKP